MKSLNLPENLRNRIEKYHLFLAIHHNLNAYHSLFQGLSVQLFTELKATIYDRLFHDAPFFQNAPDEFIHQIVLVLEETTFSPGEAVIVQGEIGAEMYWILRGRCDVIDASGLKVVATLMENQFFGEVALLAATPRLCTVRAATYSLLAQITRDKFLPIVDDFPAQKQFFIEKIRSYQLNKEEDDEWSDEDEGTETTGGSKALARRDTDEGQDGELGERQGSKNSSSKNSRTSGGVEEQRCGTNIPGTTLLQDDDDPKKDSLGEADSDDYDAEKELPVSARRSSNYTPGAAPRKSSFASPSPHVKNRDRRASFHGNVLPPGVDSIRTSLEDADLNANSAANSSRTLPDISTSSGHFVSAPPPDITVHHQGSFRGRGSVASAAATGSASLRRYSQRSDGGGAVPPPSNSMRRSLYSTAQRNQMEQRPMTQLDQDLELEVARLHKEQMKNIHRTTFVGAQHAKTAGGVTHERSGAAQGGSATLHRGGAAWEQSSSAGDGAHCIGPTNASDSSHRRGSAAAAGRALLDASALKREDPHGSRRGSALPAEVGSLAGHVSGLAKAVTKVVVGNRLMRKSFAAGEQFMGRKSFVAGEHLGDHDHQASGGLPLFAGESGPHQSQTSVVAPGLVQLPAALAGPRSQSSSRELLWHHVVDT